MGSRAAVWHAEALSAPENRRYLIITKECEKRWNKRVEFVFFLGAEYECVVPDVDNVTSSEETTTDEGVKTGAGVKNTFIESDAEEAKKDEQLFDLASWAINDA